MRCSGPEPVSRLVQFASLTAPIAPQLPSTELGVMIEDVNIVPGQRIGPFRLGMTETELRFFLESIHVGAREFHDVELFGNLS